jgi:hypothetical protein
MLRTGQLFDFPLRREDLSSRRGVNYRGPWRLLGPDLHRLANASLSLGLLDHHLLFTSTPEQSGRTRVHKLSSVMLPPQSIRAAARQVELADAPLYQREAASSRTPPAPVLEVAAPSEVAVGCSGECRS